MMMKTTPFHPRLNELNQTGLYGHWAGYLSTLRYDLSAKHEYFAVRNSAGFFDTSPLYKYRITGADSERFLAGIMTRDVRRCRPGQAMYTVWCDEAGYVLEDGVLFRHAEDDWLLTAADPNLGYLDALVGRLRVSIEDVSADYGVLAVQGPRSRADPGVARSRGGRPAVLRAHARQDRWRPGDHLPDRLLRRPGLRGVRRGRRRPRRARQAHPGRRRAGVPPLRRGCPADAADRGRPGPDRRRVLLRPLRVHRRRAVHPQGARLRLDARQERRRRSARTGRSSAAAPSSASSATAPRAGRRSGCGSTGRSSNGSTSSAAWSCPRTRTRSPGSRCSTAAPSATSASATPPA